MKLLRNIIGMPLAVIGMILALPGAMILIIAALIVEPNKEQ